MNYTETKLELQKQYMRRAIELAKLGTGRVNPNPLVGAVIVKDDKIIGEGYHRQYGKLHAERDALANLSENAKGADMYVTLEPCCHYGKQPPCANAIIEHGIKRVYVGSDDPNVLVSGGGYKLLRDAGIEVVTHFLKDECDAINDVFFHYIVKKVPYIAMKYAMTMDGKIATRTGESKWITGEKARSYVMELRNKYTGILVGIGTVLKDNPSLTCRIEGGRNPIPIVCDSKLLIPQDSNLVKNAAKVNTIVATLSQDKEKIQRLRASGVKVINTKDKNGHIDLKDLMIILGEMKIDGILLEGGGRLNYSFLEENLVNEALVFIAPKAFGGENALCPVAGAGVEFPDDAFQFDYIDGVQTFDQDILIRYKKRR